MSEHRIKPTSGAPTGRKLIRYAELARELNQGIAEGRWAVGALLPTEFELCEQYDASRHTVRMAIAELQELGLVSRRKKVGTRVEAQTSPSGYRQSLASVSDLIQFSATHRREVLEAGEIACDAKLARILGCEAGARWLRISTLRRDGRPSKPPVAQTDIYVDPAFEDLPDLARAEPEILISNLIERRYGRRIAEIRQDVQAILVPDKLSDLLKVEKGSPALKVTRRYYDVAGDILELGVAIHPADRFTMSTRIRRRAGD